MTATATFAPSTQVFPTDDSLCESCGYSLRGLSGSERCPECGTPLAESDPARRVGLPWQNRMSVGSWLKTTWMMVRSPRHAYRIMKVGRYDVPFRFSDQFYLLVAALCGGFTSAGVVWAALALSSFVGSSYLFLTMLIPIAAALATPLVIVLTHIEAAGVTWVAKRRKWRVPYRLARHVASFAAIGWLPAVVLNVVVLAIYFEWFDWDPFTGSRVDYLILAVVFGLSTLWFETLVWLGVRQCRYANFAYSSGANLTR